VACLAVPYFSHCYVINSTVFKKKLIERKMCVAIPYVFLILRRIQRDITVNVHKCTYKVPLFLSYLKKKKL